MAAQVAMRRIGRYELVREIGRGATSVVHLARQIDLDRNVALKELAVSPSARPAFAERFLRESRLIASLAHPSIVTVHEYFEHEGAAFIAMEYFERGSLRPWIDTMSLPQVVGVLESLLSGLAHAEEHGVVHRDLKPENVLVTASGGVKIGDFGIARALASDGQAVTTAGGMVGTPAYMAPEQATGSAIGPWTDLYALGVLAYEMLAGEVPFHGSDVPLAIVLQHVNEPAPSLGSARPDLDPALSDWVARLLAKDPASRPRSARSVSDGLDEIAIRALGPRWRRSSRLVEGGVAGDVAPTTTPTRESPTVVLPGRLRRRRLGAVLAVVATACLGVAVAAVIASRDAESPGVRAGGTAGGPTTSSTRETEPAVTPAGPVLQRARFSGRDGASATLLFGGGALHEGSVTVRDGDLSDGDGRFVIRGPSIRTRVPGGSGGDVRLRVRKQGSNLLVVDVTARAGSFRSLRARRGGAHTVVVAVTRVASRPSGSDQPPPSGNTRSDDRTPPAVTDESPTTTSAKPKPKPTPTPPADEPPPTETIIG